MPFGFKKYANTHFSASCASSFPHVTLLFPLIDPLTVPCRLPTYSQPTTNLFPADYLPISSQFYAGYQPVPCRFPTDKFVVFFDGMVGFGLIFLF